MVQLHAVPMESLAHMDQSHSNWLSSMLFSSCKSPPKPGSSPDSLGHLRMCLLAPSPWLETACLGEGQSYRKFWFCSNPLSMLLATLHPPSANGLPWLQHRAWQRTAGDSQCLINNLCAQEGRHVHSIITNYIRVQFRQTSHCRIPLHYQTAGCCFIPPNSMSPPIPPAPVSIQVAVTDFFTLLHTGSVTV
jgi:hypothetical protein